MAWRDSVTRPDPNTPDLRLADEYSVQQQQQQQQQQQFVVRQELSMQMGCWLLLQ
jgi:hypothetical protein